MLQYFIMKIKKEDKFNHFWELYPRRVSKFAAKRSWGRLTNKEVEEVLEIIDQHILRWKDKELQYIPHASTWLNQKRWKDELEPLPIKELTIGDKLEIQRVKFEKQMKKANENVATDEEKRKALGLK